MNQSIKTTPANKKMSLLKKALETLLQVIFCLSIIYGTEWLLGKLLHRSETLNPLSNKIEDFRLSDFVFAHMHKKTDPETNIILVNWNNNRDSMAKMINNIEAYKPAAIGLDIIFNSYEPKRDNFLIDIINRHKSNIVLATFDEEHNNVSNNRPFYRSMKNRNDGIDFFDSTNYLVAKAFRHSQ